ncbi:hydrolase [Candidatus Magnetomonas plexicatena]|uniref:hydrolase n=1 Tax=Candidatus Magnetomonas plexicatena TaxID=2552947 RepID=UPI00110486E6|nr:hydrolase [Nitrospirales bacterium LBB_01]
MNIFTINPDDTVLLIVDIQEKLASVVEDSEALTSNTINLVETAKLNNMPIVVTEQYPKGIGSTVKELKDALKGIEICEKMTFSACGIKNFCEEKLHKRPKVLLCGIETHICVLQTALDLLNSGYVVHVVSDCVSSRRGYNKDVGLRFMHDAGAVITTAETAIFQILKQAGTENFKAISKRMK